MGRPKTKQDPTRKNFLFDGEVAKMIEAGKNLNGMTETEFVEYAVRNNMASLNPVDKIKQLESKRKELRQDIEGVEKQIESLTLQLQQYDNWNKVKQQRKPQAIENIAMAIFDNRPEDAEKFARYWQAMLGIPAQQLIIEAMATIKTKRG